MRSRRFAVSVIVNYVVLATFFIEIVIPISLSVRVAAAVTLTLIAIVAIVSAASTHPDDVTYCAGVLVSGLLFIATALWFKWALDNPVKEPPALSEFVQGVLMTNANVLYGVLLVTVTTVVAFIGLRIGRRFRIRGSA